MPPLNPVSRTAPITSLAFLGRTHLLAGEATCVNIFTLPASASCSSAAVAAPPRKKRVLDRDRIHGIVPSADESTILFWGGRSIALAATASVLADEDLVKPEIKAPDWVLSAAFLPGGNVVAVGAHNEILVYTRSSNRWVTVSCGSAERTMLYSADIFVGCGGEVTVAAGTVFGEIIIWSWSRDAERGRVFKRFRGHEGSIFAVRFDAQARWLGSCSDDRTVRVWDLVSTDAEEEAVERQTTGFGEVKGEAKGGRGCAAMGWGHQARPWGVRFLPEEDGEVRLASVSEDLTARFWGFVPKLGETALMETRNSWMLHQGKSIWAFALDCERKLMATGGNDGRVGILDYSDNAETHEQWALEEVVPPAPVIDDKEDDQKDEPEPAPGKKVVKKKKKPKPNAFRGFAVVDRERFIATTVYGEIVLYTIPDRTWRILGTWEGLKNWSTVTAWQGTGILVIGDNDGQLGILDIDNSREWWWDAGGRGKVADLFVGDTGGGAFPFVPVLVDSPAYGPVIEEIVDYLQVLATSVAASSFILHSIRLQDDGPPIRHCLSLLSPAPQKFVATSALITKSQVFLGSRSGDLAIYSLPASHSATGELAPESYHPALYCDDTITSLHLAPTSPPTLATASFSGVYTRHTLPSLTTTNISKPGNVTVITGLFFSPSNDLHIFGFRGTRFIVHNTSTAADTLSVECGGAHRSWKFSPHLEAPWFVWLQAGKVHLHRSFHPRHQVLKHGAHGREIKAAAYCPSTRLLATGAEDTTIRITSVTTDGAVQEEGAVMVKKHTTGVLRLVWSEDGERLFSSGGIEELFVFRVRPGPVIGVVLESTLPVPPSEAETRICGLDVVSTTTPGPRSYMVATAMSDGHIKVWLYNPSSGAWAVVGHAVYGTCCILHAKFLQPEGDGGNLSLLVAATDGHLAVYDMRPNVDVEKPMDQVWRQRVHQSGVKALSLAPSLVPTSSELTILTGGDDCAIASTTISRAGGQWETKECTLVELAHATAVISVVPLKNDGAVTLGVDQRIKLWSRGKEGLESRGSVGSMIADPGATVVVDGDGETEGIVVTGVGIESWRFDGV